MKKQNNTLSFQGMGQMIVKYHKYTPELAKEILESPLFSRLKTHQSDFSEKLEVGVHKLLKDLNIINEHGDVIGLRPKKVVIKDGNETIPDHIEADFIIQKGGEVSGILRGDKVQVSAGINGGVRSNTYKQMLTPNVKGTITADKARLYKTITTGSIDALNLKAKDSVIKKNIYGKKATLLGKTKVEDVISYDDLTACNKTKFKKSSEIQASTLELKDKSSVAGSLFSSDVNMNGNSSLAKTCTGDIKETARLFNDSKIAGKLDMGNLLVKDSAEIADTAVLNVKNETTLSDTSVINGTINGNNVNIYANTKVGGNINGNLILIHNYAKTLENSRIFSDKGTIAIYDNCEIGGKVSGYNVHMGDKVELLPTSDCFGKNSITLQCNVKADGLMSSPKISLSDNVAVNGIIKESKIDRITDTVAISPSVKFDNQTFKTLPNYRQQAFMSKGGIVI